MAEALQQVLLAVKQGIFKGKKGAKRRGSERTGRWGGARGGGGYGEEGGERVEGTGRAGTDVYIYFHIPVYTFIYLQITPNTFIYLYVPPYTSKYPILGK